MTITDEAVEAAAEVVYQRQHAEHNFPMGDWTSLESQYREPWITDARAALEAAGPHIRAQALRDAAKDVPEYDLPFMVNGRAVEHVSWWLAARADEHRR